MHNFKKKMVKRPSFFEAGELSLRWNQIVPSLLKTYEKLKKLGYIISNGQVSIVEPEKEEKHV